MMGRVSYEISKREPDKVKTGTNKIVEDGP